MEYIMNISMVITRQETRKCVCIEQDKLNYLLGHLSNSSLGNANKKVNNNQNTCLNTS